jgi:cytochrome c oxidase subunit II
VRKRLRLIPGLVVLALGAVACVSNAPQDSLNPQGPYAREIDNLFIPVFWIAVAVFVIVEGGILFFLWKYRHRKGRDRLPPQVHGNTKLEIGWTILPTLILVGVAVPTVTTLFDLARKPSGDVVNVTVQGHQWWWEFDYTNPDMAVGGQPLVTANELVIPTGRPVWVTLESAGGLIGGANPDHQVIHSFWPAELSGKQDVIPNRTNHLKLQADHPGTYLGQCLEFCGLSHANMRFHVVAMTPADFETWVSQQKQDAVTPPSGSLASRGMELFNGGLPGGGQCIACHGIQGVSYKAGTPALNAAPNLTHFGSRSCFAGCIFDNADADQIRAWLHDPPAEKPGSKMPNYHLSNDEIDALVAYLQSLK